MSGVQKNATVAQGAHLTQPDRNGTQHVDVTTTAATTAGGLNPTEITDEVDRITSRAEQALQATTVLADMARGLRDENMRLRQQVARVGVEHQQAAQERIDVQAASIALVESALTMLKGLGKDAPPVVNLTQALEGFEAVKKHMAALIEQPPAVSEEKSDIDQHIRQWTKQLFPEDHEAVATAFMDALEVLRRVEDAPLMGDFVRTAELSIIGDEADEARRAIWHAIRMAVLVNAGVKLNNGGQEYMETVTCPQCKLHKDERKDPIRYKIEKRKLYPVTGAEADRVVYEINGPELDEGALASLAEFVEAFSAGKPLAAYRGEQDAAAVVFNRLSMNRAHLANDDRVLEYHLFASAPVPQELVDQIYDLFPTEQFRLMQVQGLMDQAPVLLPSSAMQNDDMGAPPPPPPADAGAPAGVAEPAPWKVLSDKLASRRLNKWLKAYSKKSFNWNGPARQGITVGDAEKMLDECASNSTAKKDSTFTSMVARFRERFTDGNEEILSGRGEHRDKKLEMLLDIVRAFTWLTDKKVRR